VDQPGPLSVGALATFAAAAPDGAPGQLMVFGDSDFATNFYLDLPMGGEGLGAITPYVGAGIVRIESKPKGNLLTLSPTLTDEGITQPRYFGGVRLSLIPLVSITGEVEYAERATYSLKAAVGF
jgi:hypothetical protein